MYAISASPQVWSVSADNTLYQGVVITAPTGVNTKHNLELQCNFAGRAGVGHFDLIGVDGDPGSDVPPASPIEIGSAIACGCEARAVLGNRTGSPARALRRNAIADAQFIGRQTVNPAPCFYVYINSHAL